MGTGIPRRAPGLAHGKFNVVNYIQYVKTTEMSSKTCLRLRPARRRGTEDARTGARRRASALLGAPIETVTIARSRRPRRCRPRRSTQRSCRATDLAGPHGADTLRPALWRGHGAARRRDRSGSAIARTAAVARAIYDGESRELGRMREIAAGSATLRAVERDFETGATPCRRTVSRGCSRLARPGPGSTAIVRDGFSGCTRRATSTGCS